MTWNSFDSRVHARSMRLSAVSVRGRFPEKRLRAPTRHRSPRLPTRRNRHRETSRLARTSRDGGGGSLRASRPASAPPPRRLLARQSIRSGKSGRRAGASRMGRHRQPVLEAGQEERRGRSRGRLRRHAEEHLVPGTAQASGQGAPKGARETRVRRRRRFANRRRRRLSLPDVFPRAGRERL